MKTILFVCIGNICRSPMAEIILKSRLASTHPDVIVNSAGLGALVDHQADPIGQQLLRERGLDLSTHRARQLTQSILFASDLVLTMTRDQQEQIELLYPAMRGRVHRLGKWGNFDVPDPYKRHNFIFEQSLVMIEQGIDEWILRVWGSVNREIYT